MRLALLANPDNVHARRWVDYLRGRGHEILLIADPHAKTRPEGIEVAVARWNLLSNTLAFRLTPRPHGNALWKPLHYRPILRGFRPEVVHGFEAYYNGLATAWAGPYPKVLTPWGDDIHRVGLGGGLGGWIVRRALARAHRITTNDEGLADFLAEHYGIERAKVQAFSWGVDLSVFKPVEPETLVQWRAKLDLAPEVPLLFSPRVFAPHWGAELVIEAFGRLARKKVAAVLVVLTHGGDETFVRAMKSRAESLECAGAIRWIERWLQPAEMAQLFTLAEAFVSVPATDLLAMTLLEGMACGCLPVVADLPAYRSRLRAAENAVVIEERSAEALAEGLATAIGNREFRARAAEMNREIVNREEDAETNMAQIEEVYEAAIAEFGRER